MPLQWPHFLKRPVCLGQEAKAITNDGLTARKSDFQHPVLKLYVHFLLRTIASGLIQLL